MVLLQPKFICLIKQKGCQTMEQLAGNPQLKLSIEAPGQAVKLMTQDRKVPGLIPTKILLCHHRIVDGFSMITS